MVVEHPGFVSCSRIHVAMRLLKIILARLSWRLDRFAEECKRESIFEPRKLRRLRKHFDTIAGKFECEFALCFELLIDFQPSVGGLRHETSVLIQALHLQIAKELPYRIPSGLSKPAIETMIASAEATIRQTLPQLQALVSQSSALVEQKSIAANQLELVLADITTKI